MAMLGQASGGFTESSSALRLLHVGIRNTNAILTDDAFTQTNPPIITTPASTISATVDTGVLGVLSGSVAITRPDQGSNYVGGPGSSTVIAAGGGGVAGTDSASSFKLAYQPVGLFINTAVGNAYENTPGPASGLGPYVSAMGTYASQLYETQALVALGGTLPQGADITYISGVPLITSLNGYLMPSRVWNGAITNNDLVTTALQSAVLNAASSSTTVAILRMPADSTQPEIVFDQRI